MPSTFETTGVDIAVAGPNAPGISLAPLTEADCDRLGAAFAAIDPWARYPYPAKALSAYLAGIEPGAPRWAIVVGGDIAGAVGLRLNWLRGPYIQFLGLLPEEQGHGAGGLVLRWIERQALEGGARNLWVCASDFNARGIKFYRQQGFHEIAAIEGLVHDNRTELLLRKRLSTPLA
ncbi:MAG: GNAT family N-acetyltransferase [Hyphomicrobium sp.]